MGTSRVSPKTVSVLKKGQVIPAHPLALTAARKQAKARRFKRINDNVDYLSPDELARLFQLLDAALKGLQDYVSAQ